MPTVQSSEITFRGKFLTIKTDQVQVDNAKSIRVEYVDHPGGVGLLPITDDGNILLVTQYRHSTGQVLLEIPAGTIEPGEEPAITAQRELQEEAGVSAEKLTSLGTFFLAPGYTAEKMFLFLATGLSESRLPQDIDEDVSVREYSLPDITKLLANGQIHDAKTALALLQYLHFQK